MADVPVLGFVLWRDADKSPPETIGPKLTDQGLGYRRLATCHWHRESDGEPMDPQPSVWCDPSPPDMSDPLLADLRTLVKAGEWATTIADWDLHRRKENEIAAARVRALLPKEGEDGE